MKKYLSFIIVLMALMLNCQGGIIQSQWTTNPPGTSLSGTVLTGVGLLNTTNIFTGTNMFQALVNSSNLNNTAGWNLNTNGNGNFGGTIAATTLNISGASFNANASGMSIGTAGFWGSWFGGSPLTIIGGGGLKITGNGIITCTGGITSSNGFSSYTSHIINAVSVGGSPFNFTNTTPFAIECYFDDAAAYSISKNGVTVYSSLSGAKYFVLQSTNYCTITYLAAAPTLNTNNW